MARNFIFSFMTFWESVVAFRWFTFSGVNSSRETVKITIFKKRLSVSD